MVPFFVEIGLESGLLDLHAVFALSLGARFERGGSVDYQIRDFVERVAFFLGIGDADVDVDVSLRKVLPPTHVGPLD